MLRITDKISKEEYKSFFERYANANALQNYGWKGVKESEGWNFTYLGVYDDDKLVLVASLLKRNLKKVFKMGYIARGPVGEINNFEYMDYFINNVKKYAKDCTFLKFDVNCLEQSSLLGKDNTEQEYSKRINRSFLDADYKKVPSDKMEDTIQPRFNANIYLSEKSIELSSYDSKNRSLLSVENKPYLTFINVGEENIDDFVECVNGTEERQGISLRNREYFLKMIRSMPDKYFLTLTQLDLDKAISETKKNVENLEEQISKASAKRMDGLKSREKKQRDLLEYFKEKKEKYPEGKLFINGQLVIISGLVGEGLYAGNKSEFLKVGAMDALYFYQIQESYKRGLKIFGLGGVDNSLKDRLYKFKKKFNPNIDAYLGEYDYVIKPIRYKLFNFLVNLRKKVK